LCSCKNYENENAILNSDVLRLKAEIESKNQLIASLNDIIKAKDLIIEAKISELETLKLNLVQNKPDPEPVQNSVTTDDAIRFTKTHINDYNLNCIDEIQFLDYTARKLSNGNFNVFVTFVDNSMSKRKRTNVYLVNILDGGKSYKINDVHRFQSICH